MHDLQLIGDNIKLELKKSAVITPGNYSFENALKSAYLILQETVDRNKRPALDVCTPESIHNALMNMATQGLNPAKKQCYFVVYGQQLQCIRSYMGSQMTAMLVNPTVNDIRAQVIYSGDDVEIDIENGRDVVKKHKRKFQDINKADIIGAYAIGVTGDERQIFCEIMTIDEIKASWKQSKMSAVSESGAINQGTTHGKFTGEMSKRTVINRLCKRIINTSDDSALLKSYAETEDEDTEAQVEIRQPENLIPLDFKKEPPQLPQPDPQPQPETANRDQAKQIYELEEKAGRADKILQTLSSYTNRQIDKLSELTAQEAKNYIRIVELELESKADEKQAGPSWG